MTMVLWLWRWWRSRPLIPGVRRAALVAHRRTAALADPPSAAPEPHRRTVVLEPTP